jgi:outer membrane lipoprotein SlyB
MPSRLFRSSLAAAALAVTLAPVLAQAQPSCREQKHDNRVIGTVLGAVGGAFLGNAIGEHGGKEGGTIIGGVGGAVAGNAIGGATVNCSSNQYGYYDDSGRWVPNTVTEEGYYDANGRWVATAPQRSADYLPPPPQGEGYDRVAVYGHDRWEGAPMDTRAREDWLQSKIQARVADGRLDDRRGRHALRDLNDIRRIDADYRDADGHLNSDQRRDILARLDTLHDSLWTDRGRD